jgi:hypothetical protein
MKRFSGIFFTVVILLLLFSAMAYCITWSTKKRLTNNEGGSGSPAIAVDGSDIYVVWCDDTTGNPDISELYFKKSVDGGITWTTGKRITHNAGNSVFPAIAVDGSNIYVVWEDSTPGNKEIYFKRSDDGGVTWTTGKRLSYRDGQSMAPDIAVDGSNIYVVWYDDRSLVRDRGIYFKRSDDEGATWSAHERLTNNVGENSLPAIAVDGSNIYIVWYYDPSGTTLDSEIYFKKSDDGGVTWTADMRLTNKEVDSVSPDIAIDGSNIYVVWVDNIAGNSEIYFKKSDDGGATWTNDDRLTHNTGFSLRPAIAVDGSNIYVVWEDSTPGNQEIYFKNSDDGGVTWTTGKRLTNNISSSYAPDIAADGSNIYVVWEDNRGGDYEIFFKKGNLY